MATGKTARDCDGAGKHPVLQGGAIGSLQAGWAMLLAGSVGLLVAGSPEAVREPEPELDPLVYFERNYETARTRYQENTNNVAAACGLAQAAFDLADYVPNNLRRDELALAGVQVCHQALQLDTNSAPAHYFLAMNMGQLARSRPFSALKLVRRMEKEFQRAIALNSRLDHAGPDRSLGLLYRDAPGWPASIGNRQSARQHMTRAVSLAGDYPENRLTLAESGVLWKDIALVESQVVALREILPAARKTLADGPRWSLEWVAWDRRWKALLEDLERLKKRGFR